MMMLILWYIFGLVNEVIFNFLIVYLMCCFLVIYLLKLIVMLDDKGVGKKILVFVIFLI